MYCVLCRSEDVTLDCVVRSDRHVGLTVLLDIHKLLTVGVDLLVP